jgi:hypothetical protein
MSFATRVRTWGVAPLYSTQCTQIYVYSFERVFRGIWRNAGNVSLMFRVCLFKRGISFYMKVFEPRVTNLNKSRTLSSSPLLFVLLQPFVLLWSTLLMTSTICYVLYRNMVIHLLIYWPEIWKAKAEGKTYTINDNIFITAQVNVHIETYL